MSMTNIQRQEFRTRHLKPYLLDVFNDLRLRCRPAPKEDVIDKLNFVQFANLPGIVSERIHKMSRIAPGVDDVPSTSFLSLQSNIFCGDRQEKQRILNCVFDAEESGLIRLDEVELVMTHIETDRKVKAKVMKEISQFDKACRIEPDSIIGKVVFDMLE